MDYIPLEENNNIIYINGRAYDTVYDMFVDEFEDVNTLEVSVTLDVDTKMQCSKYFY